MPVNIVLQAATSSMGGQWGSLIMLLLIFVVFYFFMIRPQMKKQKEIRKFRESIKTGDKVITAGGIYGKVKDIKETVIVLEIADGVRIQVDKGSIYATAQDATTTNNNGAAQ